MRGLRLILITALPAVVVGCAPPPEMTVVESGVGERPTANLVLGSARRHAIVGQEYAFRSDWPAAYHGFIEDEITYYNDIRYDTQRYYDRNNYMEYQSDYTRFGVFRR